LVIPQVISCQDHIPPFKEGICESKEQNGPGPDALKYFKLLVDKSKGSLMFSKQETSSSSGPRPALRFNRALLQTDGHAW